MERAKKYFRILIVIYLVVLIWGILFKMNRFATIERNFDVMIKLDLFSRLTYSLNPFVMKATTAKENLLNILVFVPFGFTVSASDQKIRFFKTLGISFLLSAIFEVTQIFTAIGGFSTIDLICNTFGGIIGFLGCAVIKFCLKRLNEKTRRHLVAVFLVICYIILIPIAIYATIQTVANIDFYVSLYTD
ncbi:MAG: VanZ family protein [Clostridia bacterium]|nr:VanZ family protein [Clostridia bacterium]